MTKKRKSPIRHKVKAHRREGKRVREHVRGQRQSRVVTKKRIICKYQIPKTFKGHKVVRTDIRVNPAHHRPSGVLEVDRKFVRAVKKYGIDKRLLDTILNHERIEWKLIKKGISAKKAHEEAVKVEPKGHREQINRWLYKYWKKRK